MCPLPQIIFIFSALDEANRAQKKKSFIWLANLNPFVALILWSSKAKFQTPPISFCYLSRDYFVNYYNSNAFTMRSYGFVHLTWWKVKVH
jgi:hypothetical protein